jgi:hypothetical protein
MTQVNELDAMEQMLSSYGQDTINNFDEQKHFDPGVHLHYGHIYGFKKDVDHKNFPPCSVQEGLKRGQNVYVDDANKVLIITQQCTHWIYTNGNNSDQDKNKLQELIVAINSLNINSTGNQVPRFNTIHIYIDSVVSCIHRFSTHDFSRYFTINLFRKLEHIKNICYVPACNGTKNANSYRLFVFQDILEADAEKYKQQNGMTYKTTYVKKYYFPLLLINPDKQYSILINGLIDKRIRKDKNTYDTLLFTEANGQSKLEEYTVMVHPDIVIQEVVHENSMCADRIHRFIGNPPFLNRMEEYPLEILEKFTRQYGINIQLLMSSVQCDQMRLQSERIEDFTDESCYCGNQSLEECLKKKYAIYIKDNILVLENSRIDCMQWITKEQEAKAEQLQNSLIVKLYFLCLLKNIHTIEIQVPVSCPDSLKKKKQVHLHSLAVLSPYSLTILRCLSPVVKNIRYVPYNFYGGGNLSNRFLYIHEDVLKIFSLERSKNKKDDYVMGVFNFTIEGDLNFTIEKDVEVSEFVNQNSYQQEDQQEDQQVIMNNKNIDPEQKKNSLSILKNWLFKTTFLALLALIVSESILQKFYNTSMLGKNFIYLYKRTLAYI